MTGKSLRRTDRLNTTQLKEVIRSAVCSGRRGTEGIGIRKKDSSSLCFKSVKGGGQAEFFGKS